MVTRFTIGCLLLTFAMTASADAQIFRRWRARPNYQAQQQAYQNQQKSECQKQEEARRKQLVKQQKDEQKRLARVAKENKTAVSKQQLAQAEQELERQRQLLKQLKDTWSQQQKDARKQRRSRVATVTGENSRQVPNSQRQVAAGARSTIAPASPQVDVARQNTAPMPTLTGPVGEAPPAPSALVQQPKPVELIEPAAVTPVQAVTKDPAVVPASGVETEKPQKSISILEAPQGKSVLQTKEDPGSLNGVKLNGPKSDK